jgi:hypothetical protein
MATAAAGTAGLARPAPAGALLVWHAVSRRQLADISEAQSPGARLSAVAAAFALDLEDVQGAILADMYYHAVLWVSLQCGRVCVDGGSCSSGTPPRCLRPHTPPQSPGQLCA